MVDGSHDKLNDNEFRVWQTVTTSYDLTCPIFMSSSYSDDVAHPITTAEESSVDEDDQNFDVHEITMESIAEIPETDHNHS